MRLAAPFSLQFALADAIDNPPPSVIYFAKLIYKKLSRKTKTMDLPKRKKNTRRVIIISSE